MMKLMVLMMNSTFLPGLNFAALALTYFTVRIELKVLKPILAQNVVFFVQTFLSSLSSDALECDQI